jgi:DNA-binding CsgD family transcriptional regulator
MISWPLATSRLYGREPELQRLDELIDGISEHGWALLVRGEAGIGKTALLEAARECALAQGMQVLRTVGVESEALLPFAGLHKLLQPAWPRLGRLPAPQCAAVEAAFGLVDAAAPDIFLIALAALDLIAEMAADAPLLLVVEDAQWLDSATCRVLAFVSLRLDLEPVALLFAVRDGVASEIEEVRLPELRLGPLAEEDARELLDARAPDLDVEVRDVLLAAAEGNPLALEELPIALRQRSGGDSLLLAPLPLTERLHRVFAGRLEELPAEARVALLLAALAHDSPTTELLAAAVLMVDDAPPTQAAFELAESAGLGVLDDWGFGFRHPLMRSAVHEAAPASQRRRGHLALAEVLADEPDRRVWHLAAAALGPDERLAAELDEVAARARRRGAIGVASAALQRAVALSPSSGAKVDRLLRAAELEFELGRHRHVRELGDQASVLQLDVLGRARLALIREMAGGGPTMGTPGVVRSLVATSNEARAAGDADLAANLLFAAASRCYWTELDPEVRMSVVDGVEKLSGIDGDHRVTPALAYSAPVERGRTVIEHLTAVVRSRQTLDGAVARLYGSAAHAVGAFDLSAEIFAAGAPRLRAQGRLALLARALVLQSRPALHFGQWREAEMLATEGCRLAEECGDALFAAGALAGLAILAAHRGDTGAAEAYAARAEQAALPHGGSAVLACVQLARGIAALGAGRHADAFDELSRMFDRNDPAFHVMESCWAIGDLAEAAVHCGRRDDVLGDLADVEAVGAETPSPRLHVALAYARPLLADDAAAEDAYRKAFDTDLRLWPFDRARVLLAYGSWMRRQRRVAESRTRLRAAVGAFDALGAAQYAERARQEIRASGETTRRRTHEARDELTPQELQIAQLAAEGLSNREIGQRLYLSHRTVGSHLYRLFPKLGVTSRNQLRSALEVQQRTAVM